MSISSYAHYGTRKGKSYAHCIFSLILSPLYTSIIRLGAERVHTICKNALILPTFTQPQSCVPSFGSAITTHFLLLCFHLLVCFVTTLSKSSRLLPAILKSQYYSILLQQAHCCFLRQPSIRDECPREHSQRSFPVSSPTASAPDLSDNLLREVLRIFVLACSNDFKSRHLRYAAFQGQARGLLLGRRGHLARARAPRALSMLGVLLPQATVCRRLS